jgi:NAD(P)-dependent dehydrogenase (short-subunit alcohol dehydrogenase family)
MDTPRLALVTGGAKRVGRATCLRLARAGFDVAFTYLSSDRDADGLSREVQSLGRRPLAIRADLTDPEAAAATVFDAFTRAFPAGRLDLLVNNASAYTPATLQQTTLATSRRLMAVHYESPLLLAQKFEPLLRAARGHIVSMSDLLASRPWPQYVPYCASKAALSNLTLSLARALAPDVTVNAIAPGVVEWPPGYPEAEKEKYLKRVPLARPGTPDDVADLVLFLATAGTYITGQILPLDGGRSIT